MIHIAQPQIGEDEKQAVWAVLESGMLAQGSRVAEFETKFADYCGVKHAIATSSGTTALHAALLAHKIGPGDEVVTTPFTFIASANSIRYVGATPVFADIDPVTFNIDPAAVEQAITERTRAIMPVHLFGLTCDMDALLGIAQKHNLVVLEDACQAHGAEFGGKRAGGFGTGSFSFYPTKNMTTAEGGIITTNDDDIAEQARMIRQHGMRRRYYHDEMGYNFRMTDVHAAIGLAQLPRLEKFNETRIANAAYLGAHLTKGVVTPTVPAGYRHVFHQYTIRVPGGRRDEVLEGLRERGVGCGVYYPVPVHKQRIYEGTDCLCPKAEQASEEVLSLPIHPGLAQGDLEHIVEAVNVLC
ncbi:MAG: DegT/DnrJ/EryC1/StrS family aminotransferase [Anaerolineae bacterium]|nr:DegT/DnrJ/EryC1/StrS family aminotransferase [Anaerolineae bacterium]